MYRLLISNEALSPDLSDKIKLTQVMGYVEKKV